MDRTASDIVLLTGSSGFLGSHVLQHLLDDGNVKEIRALDKLLPCNNNEGETNYKNEEQKVKYYECDLSNLESSRDAFKGADIVLHCAGYVDYKYPADIEKLQKNNVLATENVVKLCIEENVSKLIHCSTTEVTLQSCFTGGIVAISVHKQESKLEVPSNENRLIFGDYAASKLKAEKIVLKAHKTSLSNGMDELKCVILRPTLLYGENDPHFLTKIIKLAKNNSDWMPRFWGISGKQQVTYVGNAAWAFIRAKDTLKKTPEAIAGLPVSITDDTIVEDLSHFCERLTKHSEKPVKVSSWPMPLALSYIGAFFIELLSDFGFISKFEVPPRSTIAFLGSCILYNRARASIHMNYWPKYTHEQTLAIASKYYSGLCSKKQ